MAVDYRNMNDRKSINIRKFGIWAWSRAKLMQNQEQLLTLVMMMTTVATIRYIVQFCFR